MTRAITAIALATALLFSGFSGTNPAAAGGRTITGGPLGPNGPCSGGDYYVTKQTPPLLRETKVKLLIRCIFTYGGIGDQAEFAITIADRESGLVPWAWNRWTDCRGLFQHLGRYWPARARALPARFFPRWPNSSAFNARPNIWAAMQMVRANGWGAWSTA
jgi:hypothetical protein